MFFQPMSQRLQSISEIPMSATTRALNPHLFGAPVVVPVITDVAQVGKARLRQATKGPNKLEREFEAHLRKTWEGVAFVTVQAQGLTLVLANGVRYTPDFIVSRPARVEEGECEAFTLLAYETKGFMRDDAGVKLKVAARLFPWIKFYLVTKRKKKAGGGWEIQEILP